MTKQTDKQIVPRKSGMTHGIRAFIDSGRLPSGRAFKRAMAEVEAVRARLIVKYGGDRIEPDVLMMVDSAAKAMTVQELCLLYIKKAGILRRDSMNLGNMQLHSVLERSYASYSNLARLSLEAAARLYDRKHGPGDEVLDLGRYIEQADASKGMSKGKGGSEIRQPERTSSDVSEAEGGEVAKMEQNGRDKEPESVEIGPPGASQGHESGQGEGERP